MKACGDSALFLQGIWELQKAVGKCSKLNKGIKAPPNFPLLASVSLSLLEGRGSCEYFLSLPHPSLKSRKENLWLSAAGVVP